MSLLHSQQQHLKLLRFSSGCYSARRRWYSCHSLTKQKKMTTMRTYTNFLHMQRQGQQSKQILLFHRRWMMSTPSPSDATASSSGAGGVARFKIPVHLLVYGIAFTPCVMYAAYYYSNKGKDELELETNIRERYGSQIEQSKRNNIAIGEYMRTKMNDPTQNQELTELLHRGKATRNQRVHAVDENLYGTAQGQQLKQETEQHLAAQKERKLRRKKKKKKDKATQLVEEEPSLPPMTTVQKVSSGTAIVTTIIGVYVFLFSKK